jgi:hypothetical protein
LDGIAVYLTDCDSENDGGMADPSIDLVSRLVEQINACHETDLRLAGGYLHGENQGAYPVVNGDGERLVLKYRRDEAGMERRLELADAITARLCDLGGRCHGTSYVARCPTAPSTTFSRRCPGNRSGAC